MTLLLMLLLLLLLVLLGRWCFCRQLRLCLVHERQQRGGPTQTDAMNAMRYYYFTAHAVTLIASPQMERLGRNCTPRKF